MSVQHVRNKFAIALSDGKFVSVNREKEMQNLVGSSTIEIVGASFQANEDSIFGNVNWDYVKREEEWYDSQSRNVNDIPGGPPAIWQSVADKNGMINSNYGWCVYSPENGFNSVVDMTTRRVNNQFLSVQTELSKNPESRRAIIIYTRPTMWHDYNENGRQDFMCTSTVQYLIRDNQLHTVVNMRSNDAIFGYRNDCAWQKTVQSRLADGLNVEPGPIHWQVGSLHIYARHFYLVDHYAQTGETHISLKDYKALYPHSEFSQFS
jgi:thymidylate synthase